MLLAIDVGNTQTHVGTFRGSQLVDHWRFATVREATADELASLLKGLLDLRHLVLAELEAAIVSSVVPQLNREYELLSTRYLHGAMLVVGPKVRTAMPIRIDNPRELGADRLANALAAYDRFATACIVVDFGTSTNYDAVSTDGEYLGGVLAPGVEVSMQALSERAAKLPTVDFEPPAEVIGRGTLPALQAGLIYGTAGQVDGVVGRMREELGVEARAIATGGLASSIVPFCEEVDEVDDELTLRGLRLIYERNATPAG
ncbi:MAG TPA: type III pantothenate kinase [Thermoleophilaceae bacterium]|nr:type III pantothenate kinase [Thermoleophilaceae bacterium]